jgi:hypothetical protein
LGITWYKIINNKTRWINIGSILSFILCKPIELTTPIFLRIKKLRMGMITVKIKMGKIFPP